nr:MAG TPA_asm: hypothetical protein [Caudoviricetes sp.]
MVNSILHEINIEILILLIRLIFISLSVSYKINLIITDKCEHCLSQCLTLRNRTLITYIL